MLITVYHVTDIFIGNYCRVSLYWTIGDTNMESFVLVFPQHRTGMVLNPIFWYLVMILWRKAAGFMQWEFKVNCSDNF